MLNLGGDGIGALQQDHIEPAWSIFDVVAGQILGRELNQLLLLPLVDGMEGSAERLCPTRLHLNKYQHLPVFSH